jgi:hypothetical protein
MISLLKKTSWFFVLALAPVSPALAQSSFFEVASTPYDHQMERIQTVLNAPVGYNLDGIPLALVNEWMIELRAMPYRFSREWRTPLELESAGVGDCKGKALALYDWMQLNGASNLRFIIGKRRASDAVTHAWLEWATEAGTLLLDPTFNWTAELKVSDGKSYVAFYGYEGAHKYQASGTLLAKNWGKRAPTAPAHGAITRRMRSLSALRSAPWLFDDSPIDPRFFSSRAPF